jgi:multiple sugar transport system permease protein
MIDTFQILRKRIDLYFEKDTVLGYIALAPVVIWVAAIFIYPFGYAISLSFRNQTLIGTASKWVGFATYAKVFANDQFWTALLNTVVWALGNVLGQGILALTAGLLLHGLAGRYQFLRSLFIIPWVTPAAVTAIMWAWVINPTYGVVASVMQQIGIVKTLPAFLGLPQWAMAICIVISSWRWFPFGALIILARLEALPLEQIEAAKVDGANGIQIFRFITWPFLMPVLSIQFLLGTLWSFNSFDLPWLLTQGGPGQSTTTLPILIYRSAFNTFRMSQASALSVIMFVLLGVFAVIFFKFMYIRE